MKGAPAPHVQAWVDRQVIEDVWITAITAAEVLAGAAVLPEGRRKRLLFQTIDAWIEDVLGQRVLVFDLLAAHLHGTILSIRRRIGRPIDAPDAQIAAVTLAHGAPLATRNVTDFEGTGVSLVNPWAFRETR